jgi:YaiO family outer membrane protein
MTPARRACTALALVALPWPAVADVLLTLEQGYEELDGDLPAWQSTAFAATYAGDAGDALVEWREIGRFGVADREWRVVGAGRQGDLTLTVEFSGSPDHELLPETAAAFDLAVPVVKALVLHGGVRRAAYTEEDATLYRGGFEYYVGAARASYTAVNGRLESGDSGTAHILQGDWYYGEHNRLGLVVAAGGEATRIDPDTVVVADVRSAALTGRHWFADAWGITYVAGWTEQGDFYTRQGGMLGLIFRI